MTQLEILKLASIGICARIEKEKEINENTIKDLGRENDIALHHIKNMEQQFDEIMRLIGIAEQRGGYSPIM